MATEIIIFADEVYKIVGACFEVYNEMGCGFLESVYQECLEWEMGLQGIPFASQQKLRLHYKRHPLEKTFEPDFLCYDEVVVEIKAVSALIDEHRAQVINYLAATGKRVGVLVNFGHHPGLQWERFVYTKK